MAHKTIIELFEENELDISRLYAIYAQKFPKHTDFWARLSQEEISHAQDINDVQGKEIAEKFFAANKFSRGIIKYVNDFVKEQIALAKKKRMTHIEAVNIALRVERSAVENKCFDIFVPNNALVKDTLKKLNQETSRHIQVLMKELKKPQY